MVDKNGTVTLSKRFDSSSDLLPQVVVESPSEHNDEVRHAYVVCWRVISIITMHAILRLKAYIVRHTSYNRLDETHSIETA